MAAGEHNVDLVVTDLGGGNKQAGDILMERWVTSLAEGWKVNCHRTRLSPGREHESCSLHCRFPKLTWMPCTAHVLDLFLEDVGKQDFASDLFDWARQIVKFIRAHHKPLAIFRSKSKLELKQSCATNACSVAVFQFARNV